MQSLEEKHVPDETMTDESQDFMVMEQDVGGRRGAVDHIQMRQDLHRNWSATRQFLAKVDPAKMNVLQLKLNNEFPDGGSQALIEIITDIEGQAEDLDDECNYHTEQTVNKVLDYFIEDNKFTLRMNNLEIESDTTAVASMHDLRWPIVPQF